MSVTQDLQEHGVMTEAITNVPRSEHLKHRFLSAMQKALHHQKDSVNDMIRKALQLAWCTQNSAEFMETMESWGATTDEDIMISLIRNETPFRKIYDVMILGLNEMLPSAQLYKFLMCTNKELLVSGELDGIIEAGVRQMPQSLQEDITAMVALFRTVSSRQMDSILLNTFHELMYSRELDDILIGVMSGVIQSGILDGDILNTISYLQKEVRELISVADGHYIRNIKYVLLIHSDQLKSYLPNVWYDLHGEAPWWMVILAWSTAHGMGTGIQVWNMFNVNIRMNESFVHVVSSCFLQCWIKET